MKRGRPKNQITTTLQQEKQTVFTRTYEDESSVDIWYYDEEKSNKGPYKIEIQWKNGLDKDWSKIQKDAKQMRKIERNQKKGKLMKQSKTEQKWLAPSGKMVGRTRAKNLGLIK
jgi:hypothetical protein